MERWQHEQRLLTRDTAPYNMVAVHLGHETWKLVIVEGWLNRRSGGWPDPWRFRRPPYRPAVAQIRSPRLQSASPPEPPKDRDRTVRLSFGPMKRCRRTVEVNVVCMKWGTLYGSEYSTDVRHDREKSVSAVPSSAYRRRKRFAAGGGCRADPDIRLDPPHDRTAGENWFSTGGIGGLSGRPCS